MSCSNIVVRILQIFIVLDRLQKSAKSNCTSRYQLGYVVFVWTGPFLKQRALQGSLLPKQNQNTQTTWETQVQYFNVILLNWCEPLTAVEVIWVFWRSVTIIKVLVSGAAASMWHPNVHLINDYIKKEIYEEGLLELNTHCHWSPQTGKGVQLTSVHKQWDDEECNYQQL